MQKYLRFGDKVGYGTLRLGAYYIQRTLTSRRLRRVGAFLLLSALKFSRAPKPRTPVRSGLTQALRHCGYVPLGCVFTREQSDEIHAYLTGKPLLDSRGTCQRFELASRPAGVKLGDYELDTVVHCPHVLDLANCADFLNLASDYLGFTPTITNLSLRWSFPSETPAGEVQSFHRDSELGSFKILVYLTDVDMRSGPHRYVPGSHQERMPLRLRLYSDADIARDYGAGVTVTGAAGTAFAIDTRGIHKGVPPVARPRLVLCIQYSLLPCLIYDYAPVVQKGVTVDPYINRLIVRAQA
jgi:hypothetical protein